VPTAAKPDAAKPEKADAKPAASGDGPTASLPVVPTRITSSQVVAALLIIGTLEYAEGFFAPLLAAVFISIALAPPVRWLTRLMPRWLASTVVVGALVGVVGVTGYSLADEAAAFARELPALVRQVRTIVTSAAPRTGIVQQLQRAVTELERSASSTTADGTAKVAIVEPVDVQRGVMAGTWRAIEISGNLVLLLFLVYFLLSSGDLLKLKLVKLGGDRLSERKVTLQMIEEINDKIGRFVFYQAWSGVLVGVVTWLCFAALGLRYAGLWGLAAGVMNCIPYFGPTIVMVLTAGAALVQFQSLTMVAAVAGVSVLVTSIEGMLLAPLMLGRAARVNTVATFVALMFWGWLWGAIGLVIAVPLLMTVKTVADHVESLGGWSELLGDSR
jgi:predicted PurR-regulated permease PerM